MKRECCYCGSIIDDTHIRVWEENSDISYMLVYCNYFCQSNHVFARSKGTVENIVKDLRK